MKHSRDMSTMRTSVKLDSAGRLVVPAIYRKIMGMKARDEVMMRLENDELRVFSREVAVERARALVRKYFPGDEPLSDQFISQRRAEAASEDR